MTVPMLKERDCVLPIYSSVTPYASKYAKTSIMTPHDKACLLLRTVTCWCWAKYQMVRWVKCTLLHWWSKQRQSRLLLLFFVDGTLYRLPASVIHHSSANKANSAYIDNDFKGTLEVRALCVYDNEELSCNYNDKYIVCGTSAGKFDTCWSTHLLPIWFK